MDRGAYQPYKINIPGQMSRMERDLSSSPHNPGMHTNGVSAKIFGRFISGGYVPHVCVVGAGVSGLRCAGILVEKGLKVTVLEARDRVGGRVSSSRCEQVKN